VGHQCWHLHDPASPAHDPESAAAIGDPLERVYRAIDRGVGSIIEALGDARVLLFSVKGMSSWRGANRLLDEILYRLGVTARPVPQVTNRPVTQPGSPVPRLGEILYRLKVTDNPLYGRLRTHIGGGSSASVSSYRHPANVFGWAEVATSQCFRVPAGFPVSGIRLNLEGREPQGFLKPGREADAFVEQLANDLLAIVDERTGSALVAAVHQTDSLFSGERRDALPDLMVEWASTPTGTSVHANGRGATIRARSEDIGVVEGTNAYHRTGDHLPGGFFVYAGPGVPATERTRPVDVVDFYPTICTILGFPAPAVDGTVIPELVPAR
jgi:predicted AlkP superfamily phosphohydrolase/phosphomutase